MYSQKATQSGDKLGRFIPHKNKDTGQVKVTINEDGEEVVTPAQTEGENTANASTLVEGKAKKKGLLGNKTETVPPYDVVPSMRPVVIIGPSLKVSREERNSLSDGWNDPTSNLQPDTTFRHPLIGFCLEQLP